MKNAFKIIALLLSFSLIAENTAIVPGSDENNANISQKNEGHNKSKFEKIFNFLDDPDNILAMPVATIGALQVLDLISATAHECGHALPSLVTGNYFSIEITHLGDIIFPFTGSCTLGTPPSLLTLILGPLAGVSTTYLQCATIKALYDQHTQNKSFSESFKHALKFPVTFFNNAMNTGEKYCSALLNSERIPSTERIPSSFIINTTIFFRTMHMIAESIYGFLPYDTQSDRKGDGERIWQILLGKQPPTFKVDSGAAAVGVMAVPVAIGAMKAIYKKVSQKSDQLEVKGSPQTDDALSSIINTGKNTP